MAQNLVSMAELEADAMADISSREVGPPPAPLRPRRAASLTHWARGLAMGSKFIFMPPWFFLYG